MCIARQGASVVLAGLLVVLIQTEPLLAAIRTCDTQTLRLACDGKTSGLDICPTRETLKEAVASRADAVVRELTRETILKLGKIFNLSERAEVGLTFSCIMLEGRYPSEALALLEGTYDSLQKVLEKTQEASGPIIPLIDLVLLTRTSDLDRQFEVRWAWVTQVLRDWTHPEVAIQAHNHAGRGLAWAGEPERAVAHFTQARSAAVALPVWPEEGGGRLPYLQMIVQYAAEAALWEVAAAAFTEAESAAQTLLMQPNIDLDPEILSRSQSLLREVAYPFYAGDAIC